MKKVFYESLKKYKGLGRSSFHTPGHKGNLSMLNKLLYLDFTELPLTDSLYEASGIIKKSETKLKTLFGTEKSLFSSGGNTLCIQAMLRMVASEGDKILCDRVVHRSAVSAMALLGIDPVWINREFNEESGLFEKLDINQIKKYLSQKSDFKAVYITSPNYYGILQDIKEISNECKKYNIPVLVDNAHGSHLMFTKENLHPLTQGATLVADSAHKTLPVLTGGAWLHINDEKYSQKAKDAMSLFGSTSPSYPVMASMDICRDWLEHKGKKEFFRLEKRVEKIKKIALEKGFYIPDKNLSDPVRITLGVWKLGLSGYQFRDYLYKFKIEPEFCDENYVVLIPSPYNTRQDWQRLKKAVCSLKQYDKCKNFKNFGNLKLPQKVKTLRNALMLPNKMVDLEQSKGKIAAQIVCPCPPGVPVVMPGEKIENLTIEALKNYGISELLVLK